MSDGAAQSVEVSHDLLDGFPVVEHRPKHVPVDLDDFSKLAKRRVVEWVIGTLREPTFNVLLNALGDFALDVVGNTLPMAIEVDAANPPRLAETQCGSRSLGHLRICRVFCRSMRRPPYRVHDLGDGRTPTQMMPDIESA